ncbi:MAG: insulinase family protein [Rhodothermaceae bacterium]|nr:insulinase family protein [Rhodothermaceae bacterium]
MKEKTAVDIVTHSSTFERRIIDTQVGNCTLYMLPAAVENVVSWRGAFISNPVFTNGDDLRQGLVVSLLDKGTKRRDRFQIADVLENKGAQVNYHNGGVGVGFSGRCLTRDVQDVMGVMAEQLLEPAFDEEEYQKAGMRVAASIQRSMERTGTLAYSALCRNIYSTSHPNFTHPPEEELRILSEITLESLHEYHSQHFGAKDLVLVVVGDIDPDEITRVVRSTLGGWETHKAPEAYDVAASFTSPEIAKVPMEDKSSIDVRLGHAVEMRMNHEGYVPLYLGNFVLGGNFSSRLMDVVRDQKGLTYGIRSSLIGISKFYEGHWQVGVTLSTDKLEEGIAATKEVVEEYVEKGPTEEELQQKKTTIIGTFKVELATTGGLAGNILRGVQNGFGKSYLDEFPERVNRASLQEVRESIQKHIQLDKAHMAMAGTLPEDQD